jgi:hypothetical protein
MNPGVRVHPFDPGHGAGGPDLFRRIELGSERVMSDGWRRRCKRESRDAANGSKLQFDADAAAMSVCSEFFCHDPYLLFI